MTEQREPTRYTVWFDDSVWRCRVSDNDEWIEADKLGTIMWWVRRNQKAGR